MSHDLEQRLTSLQTGTALLETQLKKEVKERERVMEKLKGVTGELMEKQKQLKELQAPKTEDNKRYLGEDCYSGIHSTCIIEILKFIM